MTQEVNELGEEVAYYPDPEELAEQQNEQTQDNDSDDDLDNYTGDEDENQDDDQDDENQDDDQDDDQDSDEDDGVFSQEGVSEPVKKFANSLSPEQKKEFETIFTKTNEDMETKANFIIEKAEEQIDKVMSVANPYLESQKRATEQYGLKQVSPEQYAAFTEDLVSDFAHKAKNPIGYVWTFLESISTPERDFVQELINVTGDNAKMQYLEDYAADKLAERKADIKARKKAADKSRTAREEEGFKKVAESKSHSDKFKALTGNEVTTEIFKSTLTAINKKFPNHPPEQRMKRAIDLAHEKAAKSVVGFQKTQKKKGSNANEQPRDKQGKFRKPPSSTNAQRTKRIDNSAKKSLKSNDFAEQLRKNPKFGKSFRK